MPFRVDAANAAPCLVGANFAFRREVFDRIGLFDPAFTNRRTARFSFGSGERRAWASTFRRWRSHVEVPPERLTKKYFRYWYTHLRPLSLAHAAAGRHRPERPADAMLRRVESVGVPLFLLPGTARELARGWVAAAAPRSTAPRRFY